MIFVCRDEIVEMLYSIHATNIMLVIEGRMSTDCLPNAKIVLINIHQCEMIHDEAPI